MNRLERFFQRLVLGPPPKVVEVPSSPTHGEEKFYTGKGGEQSFAMTLIASSKKNWG